MLSVYLCISIMYNGPENPFFAYSIQIVTFYGKVIHTLCVILTKVQPEMNTVLIFFYNPQPPQKNFWTNYLSTDVDLSWVFTDRYLILL